MASLMSVVLKSLPFTALDCTLRGGKPSESTPALKTADPATVARHLTFLPPGTPLTVSAPAPASIPWEHQEAKHQALPIWSFKYGGKPSELTEITCRAWGEGYDRYLVLERLAFGVETPFKPSTSDTDKLSTSFKPEVLAYPVGSTTPIPLPLDSKFLVQTWLVENVDLYARYSKTWPLQAFVDKALVTVFVYEFPVGSTDPPQPLKGAAAEKEGFDKAAAACDAMAEDGFGASTLEDLFADTTFFPDDTYGGVGAAAGETASLATAVTRIAVVLTWTFSRAALDYAPVPVPMGRLHPVALIEASNAQGAFEVSIQFDRPAQTQNLDNPGQCCKSADGEMLKEMSSILVTETNTPDTITQNSAAWASLFSYYRAQPTKDYSPPSTSAVAGKVDPELSLVALRMVRNDTGTKKANAPTLLVTRDFEHPALGQLQKTLYKMPRQGEFDNIHFAPPMVCPTATYVAPPPPLHDILVPLSSTPEILASLQEISMAPFCAHDCFHMHWRWADWYEVFPVGGHGDVAAWRGWGDTGPNTAIAAPQIPLNQSLFVWYRAANQITYHAFMGNHDTDGRFGDSTVAQAKTDIEPFETQYVCHHGAAYALTSDHYLAELVSSVEGTSLEMFGPRFYGSLRQLTPISSASNSWALLYWRFRYYAYFDTASGTIVLKERTTFHDLRGARDFKC